MSENKVPPLELEQSFVFLFYTGNELLKRKYEQDNNTYLNTCLDIKNTQ